MIIICKKISIIFFILFVSGFLFSADFQVKILEKKGKINLKPKNGEWKVLTNEETIASGTEIFTGFHSQLTLEIGKGSYITINQLTQAQMGDQKINVGNILTEMTMADGFIVVYAAKVKPYKNQIKISLINGSTVFENSGGEVYLRNQQGAIIKSFEGTIKVYPKILTYYFITKNEMCGITASGILIENDYFLRRKINTLPNDIKNPGQIEYYYNYIFQPYTEDSWTNDYRDSLNP
jgi:hypothetical protein